MKEQTKDMPQSRDNSGIEKTLERTNEKEENDGFFKPEETHIDEENREMQKRSLSNQKASPNQTKEALFSQVEELSMTVLHQKKKIKELEEVIQSLRGKDKTQSQEKSVERQFSSLLVEIQKSKSHINEEKHSEYQISSPSFNSPFWLWFFQAFPRYQTT